MHRAHAACIATLTFSTLALDGCQKEDLSHPAGRSPASSATSATSTATATTSIDASALLPHLASDASAETAAPDPTPRLWGLNAHRRASHAYGREGDYLLTTTGGATLTIARTADVPGHRPMCGSILDAQPIALDRPDPMLWLRVAYKAKDGPARWMLGEDVTAAQCDGGLAGVRIKGARDGVTHETLVCATRTAGKFTVSTTVDHLPTGATWGDELHPGTATPIVQTDGGAWEGTRTSSFVALAEHDVAMQLTFPTTKVHRKLIHIAGEVFPSAVFVEHEGKHTTRELWVVRGDEVDAVGLGAPASATETRVTLEGAASWRVVVRGGEGDRVLARGRYLASGPTSTRAFRVMPGFGNRVEAQDETDRVLGSGALRGAAIDAKVRPLAKLRASYTDETGDPVPAHLLIRGKDGTPNPDLGGAHTESISWYVPSGSAEIAIQPGTYEVVAVHGPAYGLARQRVTIGEGEQKAITGVVPRAYDTSEWVAADFHLHAQPSPDSRVSFDTRVAALVAEGIEFAVPTDHNRIGDYRDSIGRIAPGKLSTFPGVEITSAGVQQFGHFNAYPMKVPTTQSPEDGVPVYYDVPPREMFVDARRLGAKIIEVNHARMPPQIGYFDLTHFDANTGNAQSTFDPGFDAFEAHNGIWFPIRERVREGVIDMVGLARRGVKVAAVGNSDSHTLHFETVGWPRTWVHTPVEPKDTLGDRIALALLRGDTTVSAGPFVTMTVDGAAIGSTVVPKEKGKVTARVRVLAPSWMQVTRVKILRDDAVAATFAINARPVSGGDGGVDDVVRFNRDVVIDVPSDATLLAWAESDKPIGDAHAVTTGLPIGFTGLIRVDANGDGRVDIAKR